MTGSTPTPDSSIHIFACVEISRSMTSQFFLYMLNNPEIDAVMEREFGGANRLKANLELPTNAMPGKSINLAMHDLLTNARMRDPVFNIEFIRRAMSAAVISVHDEIKRRGLEDKQEDVEFLRHVRNACGHGNRFTFLGDEPRRPAKLEQLSITKDLDGMGPVLFDYMTPGDVVLMLDSVSRRLDSNVFP